MAPEAQPELEVALDDVHARRSYAPPTSVHTLGFSGRALGAALEARGYSATPVEELGRLGFEVRCESDGDGDDACADLLHELELLVDELDTPFVPVRGNGFVFLRPPDD